MPYTIHVNVNISSKCMNKKEPNWIVSNFYVAHNIDDENKNEKK